MERGYPICSNRFRLVPRFPSLLEFPSLFQFVSARSGKSVHGPMPVSGETFGKLQGPLVHTNSPWKFIAKGPLVHTNFPWNSYGPMAPISLWKFWSAPVSVHRVLFFQIFWLLLIFSSEQIFGVNLDTEIKAKRNNMICELITLRITKAKAKVRFGVKYLCGHECERSSVRLISIPKRKINILSGNRFHFNFRVNSRPFLLTPFATPPHSEKWNLSSRTAASF